MIRHTHNLACPPCRRSKPGGPTLRGDFGAGLAHSQPQRWWLDAPLPSRSLTLFGINAGSNKGKSRRGHRSTTTVNLDDIPWNRWTRRGTLVFADDLTIKPRTKLNNQGAHANGVKFNVCAEQVAGSPHQPAATLTPLQETDGKLRDHFLMLSCDAFMCEISTNPSSPVTQRYLASNLFILEALSQVTKMTSQFLTEKKLNNCSSDFRAHLASAWQGSGP
jgi:hypothetical protein